MVKDMRIFEYAHMSRLSVMAIEYTSVLRSIGLHCTTADSSDKTHRLSEDSGWQYHGEISGIRFDPKYKN